MPVVVPFLSGAKQINIDLAQHVVILRGSRHDKNAQMLHGEVNIVLTRPIKVTKVTIKFVGKSYTLWPEGIGANKAKYYHEKVLHKQELVLHSFRENNKSEGILEAGVHRWPFQFIISNELVETIEDDFAKVFYYLSATVHRVGMGITSPKCRRDLLLMRIPHWSNDALVANSLPTTSIISDRKLPSCDVNICIDKSSASSGTQFPISFSITPNIKQLHLESISVILAEKRVYHLPEFQAKRIEFNDYKLALLSVTSLVDPAFYDSELNFKPIKRLLHVKNAHIPLDKEPFMHRLTFSLPNCVSLNHSSSFSEIYKRHTIRIQIEVSNTKHEIIPIHFETTINILDCRLKDDFNSLPTYEEAASRSDPAIDPESEKPTGFFVCPCYLEYKKNTHCSIKDWMKIRSEQHSTNVVQSDSMPPPAYDTID